MPNIVRKLYTYYSAHVHKLLDSCTILSHISTHFYASTTPPVLWFFGGLPGNFPLITISNFLSSFRSATSSQKWRRESILEHPCNIARHIACGVQPSAAKITGEPTSSIPQASMISVPKLHSFTCIAISGKIMHLSLNGIFLRKMQCISDNPI